MTILLLLTGLALLIGGAELLVRGASRLATSFGITPLVVGLTVVAFGTSSPELAVSIKASVSGQAEIALGNVIGSNIFNVLFILGLSALIAPLVVSSKLIRLDVPLMIGLSGGVWLLALDGRLSRLEGLVLVAGLVMYTSYLIYQSRKEKENPDKGLELSETEKKSGPLKNGLMIAGGLLMLILGSRWLVESAVTIAQGLGVSELIIGLTIIAAGTSMPEVVTSVVAGLRGERDIAVGNVVGSNIFNIMGVLGITSVISSGGIEISEAITGFDIPVMTAVAIACLPIFFTGGIISRWEGAVFMGYYIAYTLYLVLAASQHDALPLFSTTMLWFVIPITVLTLVVVVVRSFKKKG